MTYVIKARKSTRAHFPDAKQRQLVSFLLVLKFLLNPLIFYLTTWNNSWVAWGSTVPFFLCIIYGFTDASGFFNAVIKVSHLPVCFIILDKFQKVNSVFQKFLYFGKIFQIELASVNTSLASLDIFHPTIGKITIIVLYIFLLSYRIINLPIVNGSAFRRAWDSPLHWVSAYILH